MYSRRVNYHHLEGYPYPHFIEIDHMVDLFSASSRVYRFANFKFEADYISDLIRQPVYEWLLEEIGPSDDMIWDIDRIYYKEEDCPKIAYSRHEWFAERKFIFSNPNKWLLCNANSSIVKLYKDVSGIAFKKEDSAMLFKLTWG